MPEDLYTQIKYLLLIGLLHSVATVIVTELLKNFFELGPIGKRLFPLLWSVTVTFVAFPHAVVLVGLKTPSFGIWIDSAALVIVGAIGAGVALQIFNLWSVLQDHVVDALKAKIKTWSTK